MKKFLTWVLITVMATLIVAGFQWSRGRQLDQQTEQAILRTAQITRGDLEITIATSGNVTVKQKSELQFKIPGYVDMVAVEVSDRVEAGEVLARLDTEELDRTIRQSEIALAQARLNLDMLIEPADAEDLELAELAIQNASQSLAIAEIRQEVTEAEGNQNVRIAQDILEQTEDAYENYQDILKKYNLPGGYAAGVNAAYMEAEGNVGITQVKAEYEIEQAQSQWLMAYNSYRQAQKSLKDLEQGPDEEQIRQAQLQIEQAQLNLEQIRESLSQALIEAPFDGVISAVNVQANTPAPTGRPAITLLDDTTFYVDVTIDEIDIGKVADGQPVTITLDAYLDVELQGEVVRIAVVPTNFGNIIAYPVQVKLIQTAGTEVRDGMTANVTISTEKLEDVLLIPNWAVRTDQSSRETYIYCYCMQDGLPTRVEITTGKRNETYTEVLSGLEEGTTVALVSEERNLLEFSGPPSRGQ